MLDVQFVFYLSAASVGNILLSVKYLLSYAHVTRKLNYVIV
jgi:hypothetical protein